MLGEWVVQCRPEGPDNVTGRSVPEVAMDMDGNVLMASILFGLIGMGMLMYGKRAGRLVPIAAGLGLMVVPYFIPNLAVLLVVCAALTGAPWVIREG
jgi:hypothetical protein